MKRNATALLALFASVGASAGDFNLVDESHALEAGWNAVYLESTPTSASCDEFFAAYPGVTRVGVYLSDAYASTAQYDSDGNAINQKPVSYWVWNRNRAAHSSLKSLVGGRSYLIYATNAVTLAYRGVPCAPAMSWRESSASSGFANLVAASISEDDAGLAASTYFREGPAGSAASIYQVAGLGESPQLLPLGIFAKPVLTPGRAYVMTATKSAEWPGVVGVTGLAPDGLCFVSNATGSVGFYLANRGTTNRTFKLAYGPGAGQASAPTLQFKTDDEWSSLASGGSVSLEFAAGEQKALAFALDRTDAANQQAGGGILTITDEGATRMRVRVPVEVQPAAASSAAVAWPTGFYVGAMTFDQVSQGTNGTLAASGGKVSATLLLVCDAEKNWHLLQRVSFGVDDTAKTRFFTRYAGAKEANLSGLRRLTCVLLDPDNPVVAASGSGNEKTFAWTVGKYASANPMRHSWHPDHDGVTRNSDGTVTLAPDGDELANYQYSVKPELFSIGNEVTFAFDSLAWNAGGTLSGTVTWKLKNIVSDLNAKDGAITCQGAFSLTRVSENGKLE